MKITRLETLRLGEFPNLVWLRVRTIGLGERALPEIWKRKDAGG